MWPVWNDEVAENCDNDSSDTFKDETGQCLVNDSAAGGSTHIHRHPLYPAIPSMCAMAYAKRPEKAPAMMEAQKKRLTLHCNSCLL